MRAWIPTAAALALLATPFSIRSQAQAPDPALDEIADAIVEAHAPAADDPDALLRQLLETAIRHAGTAAATLLIGEARELVPTLQHPDAARALTEKYLAAQPHGLGAIDAAELRVALLRHIGRTDLALASGAFEDYAASVLAIGPLGDSGDHHTRVPFGPELRFPGPGSRLSGRYGPVQTRVAARRPLRSTIDLAPDGERRVGCFYGLHQVVADADTSCYVEVSCRGSFAVFVNGQRAAVVDRHAQRLPNAVRVGIALREGHNHVLVKTGLNGFSEFSLRYHDAAGRPVPGLTQFDVRGRVAVQPHATPRADAPIPGAFQGGLERLTAAAEAAGSETATRQLLLLAAGLSAFRLRDLQVGMELLHQLDLGTAPERGRPALAFAQLLEDATPVPTEIRHGRALSLVEANAEALADHHHCCLLRAGMLEDQDKREDAVRLLESRVEQGVAGPATFDRLHRLLNGLQFAAEARRLRQHWHEAAPLDARPTLAEASVRARDGDVRGALSMLTQGLARNPQDSLRRRALDYARDLGGEAMALQLVDQLHVLEPDSLAALRDRAATLRALGRRDEATELAIRIAQHEDAAADQVRAAGDELLNAGRQAAALVAYRRALDLAPGQHELRRLVARLSGEPEFPAMARFARDGSAMIAAFEPQDRESHASSSLVLDQMIVRVFADGSSIKETHVIRRINDLRGVEQHQEATASASADEVVLVRTVGVDGKSYYPNRVSNSFAMPRLEPGAFIEEVYRQYGKSTAPAPSQDLEFHFQSPDEPYLVSELVVILPNDHPGSFRTRNYPDRPEVVEIDGDLRGHVFRRTDVPRLPAERNAPPTEEIVAVAAYGEDGDVDAAARSQRADALFRAFATEIVAERTTAVIAACEGDMARARAIHQFVHAEIAEGGSSTPDTILLRRRGARFFLEVAMLEQAGVPVEHAAVAATCEELDPRATPLFLGTESYEVPAVRVSPRDGQPFWLFAGSPRFVPLGFIPIQQLGAPALVLGPSAVEQTRLPRGRPELLTGLSVRGALQLREGGGATMKAQGALRGAGGYRATEQLRVVEEDVQKVVARQIAGSMFEGWTLRAVELEGLDENGRTLVATAELERRRALEPAGEELLLPLPLAKSDFLRSFGDRGERTTPLRLAGMTASSWEISVDPGEHFAFLEIPPPVRVRHLLMDFNLTFERDGDRVVIRREVVQRPGTIPTSQFAEWIELLRRLDLAEETNLRLVAR